MPLPVHISYEMRALLIVAVPIMHVHATLQKLQARFLLYVYGNQSVIQKSYQKIRASYQLFSTILLPVSEKQVIIL